MVEQSLKRFAFLSKSYKEKNTFHFSKKFYTLNFKLVLCTFFFKVVQYLSNFYIFTLCLFQIKKGVPFSTPSRYQRSINTLAALPLSTTGVDHG